jgi:hypothetical protein
MSPKTDERIATEARLCADVANAALKKHVNSMQQHAPVVLRQWRLLFVAMMKSRGWRWRNI